MSVSDRFLSWFDRPGLMHVMGLVTVGIVLGTLILVIAYVPDILNSTSAVETGTDLTGCRASYNSVVVDARTELDIRSSRLRRLNTATDNAQIAVTVDALFHDGANIPDLLAKLNASGAAEIDYAKQVAEAEVAYVEANDVYQDAVTLSRENPERFIAVCKSSNL